MERAVVDDLRPLQLRAGLRQLTRNRGPQDSRSVPPGRRLGPRVDTALGLQAWLCSGRQAWTTRPEGTLAYTGSGWRGAGRRRRGSGEPLARNDSGRGAVAPTLRVFRGDAVSSAGGGLVSRVGDVARRGRHAWRAGWRRMMAARPEELGETHLPRLVYATNARHVVWSLGEEGFVRCVRP